MAAPRERIKKSSSFAGPTVVLMPFVAGVIRVVSWGLVYSQAVLADSTAAATAIARPRRTMRGLWDSFTVPVPLSVRSLPTLPADRTAARAVCRPCRYQDGLQAVPVPGARRGPIHPPSSLPRWRIKSAPSKKQPIWVSGAGRASWLPRVPAAQAFPGQNWAQQVPLFVSVVVI